MLGTFKVAMDVHLAAHWAIRTVFPLGLTELLKCLYGERSRSDQIFAMRLTRILW